MTTPETNDRTHLEAQLTEIHARRERDRQQAVALLARQVLLDTRAALAGDGYDGHISAIVISADEHGGDYGTAYDLAVTAVDANGDDIAATDPGLDDVIGDVVVDTIPALDLANLYGWELHHETLLKVDDTTVAELVTEDDARPSGWQVRHSTDPDRPEGTLLPVGDVRPAPLGSTCSSLRCDRPGEVVDSVTQVVRCDEHLLTYANYRGVAEQRPAATCPIGDGSRRKKAARAIVAVTGVNLETGYRIVDETRLDLVDGDEHTRAVASVLASYASRQATAGAVAALLEAVSDCRAWVGDDGGVHTQRGRTVISAYPHRWDVAETTSALPGDPDEVATGLAADASNPHAVAKRLAELADDYAS